MSTATERRAVIDELADRVLEGRREAEAAEAGRAEIEAQIEAEAKQAFHAYLDAREEYRRLQDELVAATPGFAQLAARVAAARERQRSTQQAVQNFSRVKHEDGRITYHDDALPPAHSGLVTRAIKDHAADGAMQLIQRLGLRAL